MLTLAGQHIFSKKQGLPVHESWKVSPLGCPSEHSSPSDRVNVSRANRAISDVSEESCDVHFIFLCVWDDGVAFEPLALLATRYISTVPCINAGYSVTLNPNPLPRLDRS